MMMEDITHQMFMRGILWAALHSSVQCCQFLLLISVPKNFPTLDDRGCTLLDYTCRSDSLLPITKEIIGQCQKLLYFRAETYLENALCYPI